SSQRRVGQPEHGNPALPSKRSTRVVYAKAKKPLDPGWRLGDDVQRDALLIVTVAQHASGANDLPIKRERGPVKLQRHEKVNIGDGQLYTTVWIGCIRYGSRRSLEHRVLIAEDHHLVRHGLRRLGLSEDHFNRVSRIEPETPAHCAAYQDQCHEPGLPETGHCVSLGKNEALAIPIATRQLACEIDGEMPEGGTRRT